MAVQRTHREGTVDSTPFAAVSWQSRGALVRLEHEHPGRAYLAVRSAPTPRGDAAARDLVCAAVVRARAERISHLVTTLDASRPVCGVVLTALREQVGTHVRELECHRSGASVLVSVELLPPAADQAAGASRDARLPPVSLAWHVRVYLAAAPDVPSRGHGTTTAHAVLTVSDAKRLTGTGRAHRHPHDVDVREVGEELATARALAELADRLLADAREQAGAASTGGPAGSSGTAGTGRAPR
ncbi:MAG: DUF1876 family protein [Micrococcales bacterium]|nr:DUF1876 family protein [Micrococcales bacterium]